MNKTITVSLNSIWQPSESKLLSKLRSQMPVTVSITSIERMLFSNRYAITVDSAMTDGMLNDLFISVLSNLGYEPDVLIIEGGRESSKPGGLVGAVESTVATASTPIIAIAVIVVVLGAVYFLPKPKKL